jgi:tRNA threonylcarbamoyladenosine biosynthesis protein TsaB
MRALAIDTSTDTPGVALCDGPNCVARTPLEAIALPAVPGAPAPMPGRHAERLLGIIDAMMKQASWNRADLELVACCIGPGSFTGVRVGVATAKGIALGLGVPIVGVGSLEAMAYAHRARLFDAKEQDRALVPLLDARKSEVFWAAYGADGALIAGPGHLAAARVADLAGLVPRAKITFLGDIAARLMLNPASIVAYPASDRPDPVEIARLAEAKLSERGPDDLDALEPAYVRPPDITLPAASS